MSPTRWTLRVAAWFLLTSSVSAQEGHAPDPLFQSHDVLDVRIIAPLSTILSERPFEEELPASFQYTNSAGEAVEFDIKMRTRGRLRRQKDICDFPPMRLNFKSSQTKGTLFHKQDKVKLVTHCRHKPHYAQALLREYVAYRILNILTDASYRVRLLRITYVNAEKSNRENIQYGFLIEHRDRMARRIGKPVLEIPRTSVKALDPEYTNLISMYHYLIGNTDFSPILGMKGEICCHNHVLFGNADNPIWSIPYDFDQAGLVYTSYSSPNERFRLRNVKQRLYRGRCVNNGQIAASIAMFQASRNAIMQLVAKLDMATPGSKKMMTGYIDKFYKILSSERRVRSAIVKRCL